MSSEIQKPFARWENFSQCETEMMSKYGHSKEDADAICGGIEHRAEKGMLYKGQESLEILKSREGDMIVYGPASWETPDLEVPVPDVATVEFQQIFLTKLFAMPEEYRNVSIDHQSLIIGKAVKKAVGEDGTQYFSHVHEKGMMLATKIRGDTNLGWVQRYRDDIKKGTYSMYSIRASNAVREPAVVDGKRVNKLLDGDPIEIAIVKQGCCPKAGPLKIVSKSTDTPILGEVAETVKVSLPIEQRITQTLEDSAAKFTLPRPVKTEELKASVGLTGEQIFQKYFPTKKSE